MQALPRLGPSLMKPANVDFLHSYLLFNAFSCHLHGFLQGTPRFASAVRGLRSCSRLINGMKRITNNIYYYNDRQSFFEAGYDICNTSISSNKTFTELAHPKVGWPHPIYPNESGVPGILLQCVTTCVTFTIRLA
jgi:hypothetical protein